MNVLFLPSLCDDDVVVQGVTLEASFVGGAAGLVVDDAHHRLELLRWHNYGLMEE